MNDERSGFALHCKDAGAPAPVLTGVQAHGRLDAVLFELTLRQTYRNTGTQVLEVVYTFPLPTRGVLLGFASELNGLRRHGAIVSRPVAEQTYEASLEAGDAPVMLEALGGGLHSANIGNLKPGDEIVLECRYAQLLAFEQNRLRVAIPTTIAPRYGHAEQAGLQPQQLPQASLDADYPLALTLTVGASMADAAIECPTHRTDIRRGDDGTTRIELAAGAGLDRDLIVLVSPREARPSLLVRADDADSAAPVVLMAALQPAPGRPRERIAVKLLVDCSGSMNGDSIASARAALRGVADGLTAHDTLSLSRFGSSVEHAFAPARATPEALRRLRPLIDGVQADLGGTEMAAALGAVFELDAAADNTGGVDVLLITDGEIWQVDAMVAAARRSGHRVFAIGVGAAPAEGVLRTLAESTGGACEFATPGEALEAAAQRMLRRMREAVLTNVRLDWGGTPAWTVTPTAAPFGGDTLIAFAGFARGAVPRGVRLLADAAHGQSVERARSEADAPCPGDSLARIAAASRLAHANEAEALDLALRYQLMSKQTNCILVHERAQVDKAAEAARLHRVPSMLAAGWGGVGGDPKRVRSAAPMRSLRLDITASVVMESAAPLASPDFDPPSMQRRADAPRVAVSLEAIARSVGEYLERTGHRAGLATAVETPSVPADVRHALDGAVQLGLSRDDAWLLLAEWINTHSGRPSDATLATRVQPLTAALASFAAPAFALFARILGGVPPARPSRMQRLRDALGGKAS